MRYLINHSCDPNAVFEKWVVEGATRVAVKTIKDIKFQEPITVDYNITVKNSVSKTALMKCKCESVNCKEIVQQYKRNKNKK
jgi:SET domain-containing protein